MLHVGCSACCCTLRFTTPMAPEFLCHESSYSETRAGKFLSRVCVLSVCARVFPFVSDAAWLHPFQCARENFAVRVVRMLWYIKRCFFGTKSPGVRRAEQRQMTKCDCYFYPAQYPTDVRNTKRLATSTTDINETPTKPTNLWGVQLTATIVSRLRWFAGAN